MLETKEMKFIITTEDGKMIAGYNNLNHAETDAEDICSSSKSKKFHIYELTTSTSITDSVLQKTYQLKTTYPLPEPEPEPEEEKEPEKKEEKEGAEESKKEEDKKD
jgi:hypothetical protein